VADIDPVVLAWQRISRRTYLDTSALQAIFDNGGMIFEDEAYSPSSRALKVQGHQDDVEALRAILRVNERARFEFVVTDESVSEVDGSNEKGFSQWT